MEKMFYSEQGGFDFGRVPVNDFFQDTFTVVACVVLVLMALCATFYRKELRQLLQGLFASRISAQVIRDGAVLRERIVLLLLPCIVFVQSLFLYYIIYKYCLPADFHISSLLVFFVSLGLFVLDVVFKSLAFRFFSFMFDYDKNDKMEYLLQKLFYLTDITLLLFPLLIAVVYLNLPKILWGYLLLFLVVYSAMFVRLFMLNRKKGNSFQFFLYFCTVEILPYIIVLKTALLLGK